MGSDEKTAITTGFLALAIVVLAVAVMTPPVTDQPTGQYIKKPAKEKRVCPGTTL